MVTIKQALGIVQNALKEGDGAASWWILSWITEKSHTELIALQQENLSQAQEDLLEKTVKELIDEQKPLQYILGSVPLLSVDIAVRPPLLIPRPETEYWCSWLIEQLEPIKHMPLTILDLCTGTGCIALSLAKALPNCNVYASDISPAACAQAQENAHKNGITNITIIESDLYTKLPENTFDLIASNPPYISAEEYETLDPRVKNWEDPGALLATDSGLALLKTIIDQAPHYLKRDSATATHGIPNLITEIGYAQGPAVRGLMVEAGFAPVFVHRDLANKDRFVAGILS